MASPEFFSRLVALNALGPNVQSTSPPDGKVAKAYVCGNCDEVHDDYYSAEACCQPEVFTEYLCPACSRTHGKESGALACCSNSGSTRQPKQCPVCMRDADSYEIAADCCLHTHPTMTALGRWRVAEQVENGTPWPEAIAQNTNH